MVTLNVQGLYMYTTHARGPARLIVICTAVCVSAHKRDDLLVDACWKLTGPNVGISTTSINDEHHSLRM